MAKSAADYQTPPDAPKQKASKAKSPAQMEADSKAARVDFPIPEGLKVDGIEKGEEHDMLATFKFYGDGTMCIQSIEGMPVISQKAKDKADKADKAEDAADGGADEAAEGEGDAANEEGSDDSGSADQGDADTDQSTDEIAPDFQGQGGFVNAMSKRK